MKFDDLGSSVQTQGGEDVDRNQGAARAISVSLSSLSYEEGCHSRSYLSLYSGSHLLTPDWTGRTFHGSNR